ncbi:hypothetical protein PR048_005500 [Dryococelus australis]|uniref:Uncharacterized protein n=1 Tax=Dryococelus australis TaxID=614101 RepID=A0ABQ9I8E6_9NEOP|nr:hypothetical protein PR048_005500 [Dryococelus australis]
MGVPTSIVMMANQPLATLLSGKKTVANGFSTLPSLVYNSGSSRVDVYHPVRHGKFISCVHVKLAFSLHRQIFLPKVLSVAKRSSTVHIPAAKKQTNALMSRSSSIVPHHRSSVPELRTSLNCGGRVMMWACMGKLDSSACLNVPAHAEKAKKIFQHEFPELVSADTALQIPPDEAHAPSWLGPGNCVTLNCFGRCQRLKWKLTD